MKEIKNIITNDAVCPYCGDTNIESIDEQYDTDGSYSIKKKCYNCGDDFICWYDKDDECIEVTDRHNIPLEAKETED